MAICVRPTLLESSEDSDDDDASVSQNCISVGEETGEQGWAKEWAGTREVGVVCRSSSSTEEIELDKAFLYVWIREAGTMIRVGQIVSGT